MSGWLETDDGDETWLFTLLSSLCSAQVME